MSLWHVTVSWPSSGHLYKTQNEVQRRANNIFVIQDHIVVFDGNHKMVYFLLVWKYKGKLSVKIESSTVWLEKNNLRRECLLKRVNKGKIEGTERRGIRDTQLVGDVKENRCVRNLKQEAQDRHLWRTGIGKGYGPVARHSTRWMN